MVAHEDYCGYQVFVDVVVNGSSKGGTSESQSALEMRQDSQINLAHESAKSRWGVRHFVTSSHTCYRMKSAHLVRAIYGCKSLSQGYLCVAALKALLPPLSSVMHDDACHLHKYTQRGHVA